MMWIRLCLVLLISAHGASAQMSLLESQFPGDALREPLTPNTPSKSELYLEANRLIIEENWSEADELLILLLEEDPDNRNLAYKRTLCLGSMKGRLSEAAQWASFSVSGGFARRYNAFDPEESSPPEEALELALTVLQLSGHFSEAKAVASRMVNRFGKRDPRYIRAVKAMAECDFASACEANPTSMTLTPLASINSPAADFAPVVSPDGKTLYFTSYRNSNQRGRLEGQIFRSLKTETGWSRPISLALGTPGRDVTTVGFLGNGESLLAYQSYRNEGGIWALSQDEAGGWSMEEKLGFPIDSRHWETSMTERFDGAERIFVSNRPGGQGGRDLYRTVKLPDGSWSEPLNLGAWLNTEGDEESPVLSADGQQLVFSSNGHPGMGGFDLYRCRRLSNGSWSEPEHMGHPLNTSGDEVMLSLDLSGQTGYLSSSRAGGDDLDIYRLALNEVSEEPLVMMIGEIDGWESGDVVEVRSVDDGPAVFRVFRARESGAYVAALPPCRSYSLTWVRQGQPLAQGTERVPCDADLKSMMSLQDLTPNLERDGLESQAEESEALAGQAASTDDRSAKAATEPEGVKDPVDVAEEASSVPEPAEAMVEFSAMEQTIDFGYGQYMSSAEREEVSAVAKEIRSRRALGDVPVIEIEGSASYVPVKNKHAFDTNEQLARLRAEGARDAILQALAAQGLEVGIDFQVVLDWSVAGPDYEGDAVSGKTKYRRHQYAKFSLERVLVDQRP